MKGSDKMTRSEILEALMSPPPGGDYVWDGVSEDDRPLTAEEMRAGKRLGRPPGSNKESTTIRFDKEVLDAFRASGPGWQTRINAALREWLETHPGT